ncbi:MAG: FAD-dependent oxidoreductase [Alphaproteobacteria bacterium]|nr:FAD-dependent oxidoreductase [Alphaproteobacteria bacterium]
MSDAPKLAGPDLATGTALATLADGAMLLGHAQGEPVLIARRGDRVFAVGSTCTHYGGPLVQGLFIGETVRCPWHHACFDLRSGEALRPPALNPIPCWRVEISGGNVYVRERLATVPQREHATVPSHLKSVVIIGGGAAANAAAETLRNEGYADRLTILSADADVPCDRPNLSKDYLAGTAPEEWVPLRSVDFYRDRKIDLRLGTRAASIDVHKRQVVLADGAQLSFDALLLATGAAPVRLSVPGSDLPHVHYLRTLADSRKIIEAAKSAQRAVVVGASFIGLEVAASLRARNLEVHVVAPEKVPMERVLGREIGELVRAIHEEHGVRFRLGATATSIDRAFVTLQSGERLAGDCVIIGVGVKPELDLAEKAGLALDRGIAVNGYLETSVSGIFAAGDVARWPDPHSGQKIRVEHWVVAERQGQTAARNILGRRERFDAVPFFWSMHYDMPILYVGHAERWNEIDIDGRTSDKNCRVTYRHDGRILAVATIGRDLECLKAELAFEQSTPR